ncbi:MAG TPA: serine hydrolase [Gemmatimonadaceae bacterium]|nr:serine hydrolase [Gemmatimonadaceae bacterium]
MSRPLLSFFPSRSFSVSACALALLAACSDATTPRRAPPPIDLAAGWRTASATSQHIDSATLANAFARAPNTLGLRTLLVARNGYLIAEYYHAPVTLDSLSDVRSVTKSITSMLVGIAISRNELPGITERLDQLIPPSIATMRSDEAAITVENLLTMTGGWRWNEWTANDYNLWAGAADQVEYLLGRQLANAPGTMFTYNSAAVHLLGVGLSVATKEIEQDYAREHLLRPLGIDTVAWETDDRGYNNGGAGIQLRTRDLAKIGQLVLQNGRSASQQIVPSDWLGKSLMVRERLNNQYGDATGLNYGYLWWLTNTFWLAWGFRGQYIYIVPSQQLVVVATSALDAPGDADREAIGVLDLIVSGIEPAMH